MVSSNASTPRDDVSERYVSDCYRWQKVTWSGRARIEVWGQAAGLTQTRMWANAQPDGRPAKHRWRPLFNAAKFGW